MEHEIKPSVLFEAVLQCLLQDTHRDMIWDLAFATVHRHHTHTHKHTLTHSHTHSVAKYKYRIWEGRQDFGEGNECRSCDHRAKTARAACNMST